MLKKIKDNSGSAMLLVIFILAIVTIIIISFSHQIGNQLKSTTKNQENIQQKYDIESNIERKIANFIAGNYKKGIQIELKNDIKTSGYKKDIKGNLIKVNDVKCLYYEISYDNSFDVKIINSEKKINNPITMFLKTESSIENPNLEVFDFKKVQDVKFKVTFKETDSKRNEVLFTLSNIKNDNENIIYDVDYSILLWKS